LKGEAANERGEVTLSGLVRYLQEKVPKRVLLDLGQEKKQRPWADIQGYKADELVISISARVATEKPAAGSVDAAAVELTFWESIKNSPDVEDFREYLKEYPAGRFAGLARNRVRQLEAAAKTNAPGTEPVGGNRTNTHPVPTGENKQEHVELQTYKETAGGAGIEMVRVPAGKFTMGSPDGEGEADEHPQHEVTVSSFYMGKYEVTQGQWRAVAGLPKVKIDLKANPSKFDGNDNLPVEQVSWEEAMEFCARLSRATGKTYRLPTEAEWEYACRALTKGQYAGNLDSMAWYDRNSGGSTHEVGRKQANGFGLYDMHGSVWEWCMDWYSDSYYSRSPSTDPVGPSTGSSGCFVAAVGATSLCTCGRRFAAGTRPAPAAATSASAL
jgi:formylglycine-generating enzyme required for sulfatase activity